MSDVPISVWIALVVAVVIFALLTRRFINWPVVAVVLVLVVLLSQCEPDDLAIPGLPMPSEPGPSGGQP